MGWPESRSTPSSTRAPSALSPAVQEPGGKAPIWEEGEEEGRDGGLEKKAHVTFGSGKGDRKSTRLNSSHL